MEILCRLFGRVLRQLCSRSLGTWSLWRTSRFLDVWRWRELCCLVTVMISGVLISSVRSAGGEVSFSGAVSSRRDVGVDLGVGGGRLAAVGWRGHSPAEGAGCLLLSALLL